MTGVGHHTTDDLTGIPWLAELSADEQALLARCGEVVTFQAGQRMFSEGDAPHCLYLLVSGTVAVAKRLDASGERTKILALRGPGDPVGEMGVIEGMPRSADAKVLADVRALRISADMYRTMCTDDPQGAATLMRILLRIISGRLRHADLELVTLFEVTRIALAGADLPDLLRQTLRSLLFFCSLDAALAFLVSPFSGALEAAQGAGKTEFIAGFEPGPFGDLQRFDMSPSLRAMLAEGGARALEGDEARGLLREAFGRPHEDCTGLLLAPLRDGATLLGVIMLVDLEGEISWPPEIIPILDAVSAVIAPVVVVARARAAEKARKRFEEASGAVGL